MTKQKTSTGKTGGRGVKTTQGPPPNSDGTIGGRKGYKASILPQIYLPSLSSALLSFSLMVYDRFIEELIGANERRARVFVFGNGGSAATASHFACDLNFCLGAGFRVVCLNDNIPTMLAVGNDVGYGDIFVRQMGLFEPGDVAIGISGSGNSGNILRAIVHAKELGGVTFGWSGLGGVLAGLVDIAFVVDSYDMQIIEDCHLVMAHMLMRGLGEHYST